jgi:hypothetical protein
VLQWYFPPFAYKNSARVLPDVLLQAHKNNVNTIEDLQKTNSLLADKNKELEEHLRSASGFSSIDTRLAKRARGNDAVGEPQNTSSVHATPTMPETDVWSQFEMMMNMKPSGF